MSCLNDSFSHILECVASGIAFHHAGLSNEDRYVIETMFKEGHIKVLCATSTLAAGVNLPAHLVIIKSTFQYGPNGYEEYGELDIIQMMGRAGRPQFDTYGTAVILTTDSMKSHYENFINGSTAIESRCSFNGYVSFDISRLHTNLIEHLNAEIVLGIINDKNSAFQWIESTFFYVRVQKNPAKYNVNISATNVVEYIQDLVRKIINTLSEIGVLTINEEGKIYPNGFGSIMNKNSIQYETFRLFMNFKKSPHLSEIVLPFYYLNLSIIVAQIDLHGI